MSFRCNPGFSASLYSQPSNTGHKHFSCNRGVWIGVPKCIPEQKWNTCLMHLNSCKIYNCVLYVLLFKQHYFAKKYIMFYVIYKSGVDTVASLEMRCSRTMWWLILLVVLGSGVSSECNLASNHIWRESWINLLLHFCDIELS